jgi:hypothetical protein
VHDDDAVQATPNRKPPPWEGLGVRWLRHLRPFHRRANVRWSGRFGLVTPTAVQAEGAVHDTSLRTPAGFDTRWMRHR